MTHALVVCGGRSLERPISLESGARVARALRRRGEEVTVVEPGSALVEAIDRVRPAYAFLALHGTAGEDGSVQSVLDLLGVPYTGSDPYTSALCLDKGQFKTVCRLSGLPTPDWHTFTRDGISQHQPSRLFASLLEQCPHGVVVKPADQGSSLGITVAHDTDALRTAVLEAFNYSDRVLTEAFVPGREIAVTVMGSATDPQPLPPVEMVFDAEVYNYVAHYDLGSSSLRRAEVSSEVTTQLEEIAVRAYAMAGCRDVARVDLRLDGDQPQLLEINTIPGFTETGPSPVAADLAGLTFEDFVASVARRARGG